ncbi:hypothetical protein [Neptunicella sp. SCSIO 80796]
MADIEAHKLLVFKHKKQHPVWQIVAPLRMPVAYPGLKLSKVNFALI